MFILWVMSQVSQGVCMGPTPWQQRSARTWNVGDIWTAQLSCSAGSWLLPSPDDQGSCTGGAVLRWGTAGLWSDEEISV